MRRLTLWQAVAISTQFGFLLAAAVFVGSALGYLVDRWTGGPPVGVFVGALIGMISGIYSVVRLVQAFMTPNPPREGREPGPATGGEEHQP